MELSGCAGAVSLPWASRSHTYFITFFISNLFPCYFLIENHREVLVSQEEVHQPINVQIQDSGGLPIASIFHDMFNFFTGLEI